MNDERGSDFFDAETNFETLLDAWRAGRDAEESILEMLRPKVLAIASKTTFRDPAVTRSDLTSILNLKVVSILRQFRGQTLGEFIKFAEIALNRATIDFSKSRGGDGTGKGLITSQPEFDSTRDPSLSPSSQAISNESHDRIRAFCDKLADPIDRIVLRLMYHEELSVAAISRIIDEDYGRARARHERLLKALGLEQGREA